ncbi:MAG: hypothetical protein ACREM6_09955 [Vulcanimicrobiaceae bacterium]
MQEILPGIVRWERPIALGIPAASLWIQTAQGPVVVDPLIPRDGLDQIEALGVPRALVLTNHAHERDVAAFEARFGARRHVNALPEARASRPGVRFRAGAPLLDAFRTIDLGAVGAGETALFLSRDGGTLIVGDALFNLDVGLSPLTWLLPLMLPYGPPQPHPAWLSLRPRESRRQLSALFDLAFENLIPSHGAPIIGGAHARVVAALDAARRAHPFLVAGTS